MVAYVGRFGGAGWPLQNPSFRGFRPAKPAETHGKGVLGRHPEGTRLPEPLRCVPYRKSQFLQANPKYPQETRRTMSYVADASSTDERTKRAKAPRQRRRSTPRRRRCDRRRPRRRAAGASRRSPRRGRRTSPSAPTATASSGCWRPRSRPWPRASWRRPAWAATSPERRRDGSRCWRSARRSGCRSAASPRLRPRPTAPRSRCSPPRCALRSSRRTRRASTSPAPRRSARRSST